MHAPSSPGPATARGRAAPDLCHDLRRERHTGTLTGKAITPVPDTEARGTGANPGRAVARALLFSPARLRAEGLATKTQEDRAWQWSKRFLRTRAARG